MPWFQSAPLPGQLAPESPPSPVPSCGWAPAKARRPERPFPQGRIKRTIVRAWRQSERAVWPLATRRGRLFSRGGGHWAAMRESERGSPMTAPRAIEDLTPRSRISSGLGFGVPGAKAPAQKTAPRGERGLRSSGALFLAPLQPNSWVPRESRTSRCSWEGSEVGSSWTPPLRARLCFSRQRSRASEAASRREQRSRPERPGKESALSFGSKRASEGPLKQP